jgi:hypothetical protein
MIQQIMDKEIEKMQEKGMSDEQIDQTMKFVAFFTSAESILVIGTISIIIFMVVAGLIISIFTQKNRSETTF